MAIEAPDDHEDRLAGVLLGTALGDALGLPAEGLSPRRAARWFGRLEEFRLLGRTGFVSDDTELSALTAESLIRHPADADAASACFRRLLACWLGRIPWGVGTATLRAGLRAAAGFKSTGVRSAGNGAAMRAAVIGVFHRDRPEARRAFVEANARVTHTDARAVEGALFYAELAAQLAGRRDAGFRVTDGMRLALKELTQPDLVAALLAAEELADRSADVADAAGRLGNSGYVVHTVALALFGLLRAGDEPVAALADVSSAGGDTDTIGAVLGAWLGAARGARGLPDRLLKRIHDGPFGPSHLRALAGALARTSASGIPGEPPRYSRPAALARNLLLIPVVLAHGCRRLLP